MSVTVVLPGQLQELADGRRTIPVGPDVATVGDAFEAVRREVPAVWERIFTERRELRPHVNVFVGVADIRWSGGLETPVADGAEVTVLPSVSGG